MKGFFSKVLNTTKRIHEVSANQDREGVDGDVTRGLKIEIRALGGDAKGLLSPENDRDSIRRYRKNALENKAINMALKDLDAQLVEIRPLGAKP